MYQIIEERQTLIDYINQGVSLINYIGHGSETTLGSEKIIDMERDLNHICNTETPCNNLNKHAIWVVGTCSFGKYDESDEIMSEKLLFNNSGAIIFAEPPPISSVTSLVCFILPIIFAASET